MIKIFNKVFIIIILGCLVSGCNSVKKAFDPERKNSSQEFLVEKKSPLSMPPEFDELPVPQNTVQENQDQNEDIKELIAKKKLSQTELDEISNIDENFEDILLDKIK